MTASCDCVTQALKATSGPPVKFCITDQPFPKQLDDRMSIYSYLCCTDCKVALWLGKAVFSGVGKTNVVSLHVGPADSPPNYMNLPLSRALWEMLAAHHGHQIHTFFDYELEKIPDRDLYTEIEAEGGSDESTNSAKNNQP